MATEIKRLRPESIRTTGASANDVLVVSGGQTAFVNELFVSGLNIGTSSSIAGAKLQVVGDIEISGSIFQSGDLFSASDTGLAANLVTTGQSLLSDISTVSGLITSNDSEIAALQTATGSLQTQLTANDGDISTNAGNISTNTSNISTNTSNISTNASNLVITGQTLTTNINTVSGLITDNDAELNALRTATGSLQTQVTANDGDISTNAGNISTNTSNISTNTSNISTNTSNISTNSSNISTNTSNLATTGQTLQSQITSNDSDISTNASNISNNTSNISTNTSNISTNTSNISTNSSNISTNASNLVTTGQTLQTQITSNDGDITSLTSNLVTTGQTLQAQVTSLQTATGTLNSTTVKTTTNQTVAGNKTFTDLVTINNLTVTGTETIVSTANLNVKDNIILINSGEAGAGISLVSGGLEIDRGSATNANILFNDSTDQFELNFPIATEGNLVATAPNLISTGQTLQTQITSNDGDISTLTSNLVTTGQTLQTQITSNDSDISTLTSNLSTTDSNLVTTGQTLQTQITSNDGDISTNAGNISTNTSNISTNTSNISTNTSSISTNASNLVTTGQTLQTQITSNDSDISTLTSNLTSTGSTLDAKIDTLSGIVALDSETGDHVTTSMTGGFATKTIHESFSQGLNVGTSTTLGGRKLHVVGDIEISGTIFQSGSKFEGGGGGGGGGGAGGVGDLTSDVYAGDGTTTGYALSIAPTGVNSVLVSVGGIIQTPTTNYVVAGSSLNFSSPPPTGTEIEIRNLNYAAGYVTTAVTNTLDAKIDTLSGVVALDSETGNHVTTSMTGNLIDTSMTGSFASDADITTLTTNLVTTGQTLQTQITSNDSDISTLTTNVASTGSTLDAKIDTLSGAAVLDSETGAFGNMSPTSINSNLIPDGSGTRSLGSAANPWDDLFVSSGTINIGGKTISLTESGISFNSDISIDGTIFQSGAVFEGGGGGGGSSTFVGLSDTPGSFTANKYVRVNSAGNALEYTENIGGINTTDIFTGDGSASGFAISSTVTSTKDLLVSINGILQRPDTDYTLAGTTGLFFNTGVTSGYFIEARHIVGVSGAAGPSGAAGAAGPSGADGAAASGWAATDQGYFTGFNLAGTATGIVQNASGSVAGLDLADNKWDVSIVEESDSQAITGDANWSSVKLLLPVDGTNDATTTTDSSSNAHTVTLSNGAKISTTKSKWGGSSLFLDGTNDYGEVAYDADFDFGNADFTVELWYYPLSQQSDSYIIAVNDNSSSSAYAQAVIEGVSLGSGMKIEGGSYDSGMKWTAYSSEIALNTWHHLAYVRYNNKVYMYVNGTATDSGTAIGSLRNNSTSVLIGKRIYGTYTNAYLDDIRITKGLARYTANFTPPTEAFGTVINTVDTKYISQIGGWDDTDVDYGIKKISNSELSIKKMGADVTARPIDRLYVNVQKLGAIGQGIAFEQLYTGDGSTTAFTLPSSVSSARDLMVSVEGLVQIPTVDYSVSTTTLTFTTGVTSGNLVDARYLALGPSGAAGAAGAAGATGPSGASGVAGAAGAAGATGPSGATGATGPQGAAGNDGAAGAAGAAGANGTGVGVSFSNIFTGDGLTSGFAVESSVPEAKDLLVTLNGIIQRPVADYTLVGNTGVYFDSVLTSGFNLEARYLSMGPSGATGPAGSAADLTASGFALNTNLVATGQTLQTQITSNDGDISSLTSNLVTTGQTLQTQVTSNDSDISTLTTNVASTGSTLDSKIDTLSGVVALDSETGHLADTTKLESFSQGLNVGTSSDLASRKFHVVGDVEISGTIYQSGSVFQGGGGGGSSTFLGLSDTPGSFTASKHVAVNSAGNALEFVDGGSSANGGTGLLEIGNQKFTGDGVTSGYALTTSVNNENNLIVTVGGLVQTPVEDYTLSAGTGLYFDANIVSGTEIDVRRITANSFSVSDSVADAFTGNGVLSGFDLSFSPNNKAANVLVSLNGIIQQPDTAYSLNGTTISFASGTVASGDVIDARHITIGQSGAAGSGGGVSSATNRFTGNGVISGFEMTRSVSTADEISVYVNGLFQDSGDNFTITNGTGLYFTSGDIASGDKVIVRHIY